MFTGEWGYFLLPALTQTFSCIFSVGLFGSRGRGMTGPGRGQQQQQQQQQSDKKPGKPQGMKNQH